MVTVSGFGSTITHMVTLVPGPGTLLPQGALSRFHGCEEPRMLKQHAVDAPFSPPCGTERRPPAANWGAGTEQAGGRVDLGSVLTVDSVPREGGCAGTRGFHGGQNVKPVPAALLRDREGVGGSSAIVGPRTQLGPRQVGRDDSPNPAVQFNLSEQTHCGDAEVPVGTVEVAPLTWSPRERRTWFGVNRPQRVLRAAASRFTKTRGEPSSLVMGVEEASACVLNKAACLPSAKGQGQAETPPSPQLAAQPGRLRPAHAVLRGTARREPCWAGPPLPAAPPGTRLRRT
ncbi:hypothetical protein CB1_000279036 [Camelus ferus]|nr:hypothetical protein CB1_000279036 [Camelus ferus]